MSPKLLLFICATITASIAGLEASDFEDLHEDLDAVEADLEEAGTRYCPKPKGDDGIGPLISGVWKPAKYTGKPTASTAYFVLVGSYGIIGDDDEPTVVLAKEFKRLRYLKKGVHLIGNDFFNHIDRALATLALAPNDIGNWEMLQRSLGTLLHFTARKDGNAIAKAMGKAKETIKIVARFQEAVRILTRLRRLEIRCTFKYSSKATGAERYRALKPVKCVPSDFKGLFDNFLTTTTSYIEDTVVRFNLLERLQPESCNCYDIPGRFLRRGTFVIDGELARQRLFTPVFVAMLGTDAECSDEAKNDYAAKSRTTAVDVGTSFFKFYNREMKRLLAALVEDTVLAPVPKPLRVKVKGVQEQLRQRLAGLKTVANQPASVLKSVLKLKNGVELLNLRKATSASLKKLGPYVLNTPIPGKLNEFLNADRNAHNIAKKIVRANMASFGTTNERDGTAILTLDDFKSLNQGNHMRNPDDSLSGIEWVKEGSESDLYGFYLAPTEVAGAVDSMIIWFNDMVTSQDIMSNAILVAVRAFVWCVSIHPFHDGNGRACRLLGDIALMTGGLLPGYWSQPFAVFPMRVKLGVNDDGSSPFDRNLKTTKMIKVGILAARDAVNAICGDKQDCS